MPLEWNPVLEDRLKRAKRSAAWRWVGYAAIVLGLLAAGVGGREWTDGKAACEASAGPSERCEGPGIGAYLLPGGVFFVLGLIVALQAEKSAKEARELKIQRDAAIPAE